VTLLCGSAIFLAPSRIDNLPDNLPSSLCILMKKVLSSKDGYSLDFTYESTVSHSVVILASKALVVTKMDCFIFLK
jgi:hypothetical protein